MGKSDNAGTPSDLITGITAADPPKPRKLGESVVAPGRVLGWAEFGHPDGDPVLWFHGTPGARTQVPPSVDKVALQRGFRIIAVERPGTGSSTDHQYERILDFASDIEAVVDDLGIGRFGMVGLSGGGPYVLAVAHEMPDRVMVGTLLGGIGPTRGPDAVWSYTRVLRFMAPTLELLRSPIGSAFGPIVGTLETMGEQALAVFAALVGGSDREVLTEPEFSAMFVNDLANAKELRAVAHDIALFARHWGFLLEDVTPPVICWQGLADSIVPPSHGHHQAARLPNAQLRVRHGEGHFAGFSDAVAVLDAIREVWALESIEPIANETD
ncbi:MAG: alpha/beta fold hydrolase [Microthrixaceae bacterium]